MKLNEFFYSNKYDINIKIKRKYHLYSYEIWWLKENFKWLSEQDIKANDWEIAK